MKGKPANLKLPATAILKRDEKLQQAPKLLIVQAEVGPDGQVIYCVIGAGTIGPLPAGDLGNIQSIDEKKEQKVR
jgi:hypothetical protein